MPDPALLRTFLTVAQCRSFTEASQRLGLQQSTVSQHVRRLEQALGGRLFVRDTHSVVLTPEGEAMIGFAGSILDTAERARLYVAGARARGRLRFGASEDLVSSWLPQVLRDFIRSHPSIDLELTAALSGTLIDRLDAGELDLVFCKRWPGQDRGELVWRDRVAWAGAPADPSVPFDPVPLVVYPPPSLTRVIALEALERTGRHWRIACTSSSLSGLTAAAAAGLGVIAHASRLIPPGLCELARRPDLPVLGEVDFILIRSSRAVRGPAADLAGVISAAAARLG
jgi:DNA-binding transcriptional LysR family regulator